MPGLTPPAAKTPVNGREVWGLVCNNEGVALGSVNRRPVGTASPTKSEEEPEPQVCSNVIGFHLPGFVV